MMLLPLHLDLETRSTLDLKVVGAHRYAEHPTTQIVCGAWRRGDFRSSWRGDFVPDEIRQHIEAGGELVGHNQMFERVMLAAKGVHVDPARQNCTMARAAAMGLPQSLEQLGAVLRCGVQKDKDGHRLMLQMCRPRTVEPLTWWEDDDRLDRLQRYCAQDVGSEVGVHGTLPPLSVREQRVWQLDQRINDRGVRLDVSFVQKAIGVVDEAQRRADRKVWTLTNGAVGRVTQVARIVDWIAARGIACESIAEGEFEGLLIGAELFDDPVVAEVVKLRQASAKAFKFKAMLDHVCADGRVRGSLAYHGTHTGRWAGRGVQPQNFKRIEDDEDEDKVATALRVLAAAKNASEAVDCLELWTGDPLEALSLCSRPMLVAAPGKRLVGGDFSNIEGRLAAWFAGETWKLDAFRAYDRGEGPDLYRVTASRIIEIPVEAVTRAQRQEQGKVPELACGYQGALGAFKKMGAKYGVRLSDARILAIVRGWREQHPHIVQAWADLQEAAIEAVRAPGCTVTTLGGKVQYVVANGFLFCRIPSGRVISYASPVVEWKTKEVTIDGEVVEIHRYGVSYWGVKSGRWMKLDLYGGAQFAHVVSGTARDVLVDAMFRVEDAGYPIVLTVHDELLCEVDEGFGSAAEIEQLMAASEPWLDGLPVAVKAWEGERYAK